MKTKKKIRPPAPTIEDKKKCFQVAATKVLESAPHLFESRNDKNRVELFRRLIVDPFTSPRKSFPNISACDNIELKDSGIDYETFQGCYYGSPSVEEFVRQLTCAAFPTRAVKSVNKPSPLQSKNPKVVRKYHTRSIYRAEAAHPVFHTGP